MQSMQAFLLVFSLGNNKILGAVLWPPHCKSRVDCNRFFQACTCQAVLGAKLEQNGKTMPSRVIRKRNRDIDHRSGFTWRQILLIQFHYAAIVRSKGIVGMDKNSWNGIIRGCYADGLPGEAAVVGDIEPEGKVHSAINYSRVDDSIGDSRSGGGRRGVKR